MAAINYDDKRFAEVEADKKQALTENEQLYNGMINQSDQYFQQQIDASKEWGEKQQQLQQEQTDFTLQQIEQQKQQAEKDYKREQSGAYVDLQKQTNQYGAQAEQMAASGLANTGFSETSKVGMQNAYQNRVAMARESYNQAVLSFNNAMTEARLQNSSALAEIAYNTLQQQLQLALEGFQYHNSLVLDQANRKQDIENTYYGRYQDIVNQINQENALAEEKRQYNESLALQKAQLAEEQRQYNASLALQQQKEAQEKAMIAKSMLDKGSSGANMGQSQVSSGYSPIYSVGAGGEFGNSSSTKKKSDYYFSNGYQPRYIDNTKLAQATDSDGNKLTVGDLSDEVIKGLGVPETQKVWQANGRCYVWNGKTKEYMYIGKSNS